MVDPKWSYNFSRLIEVAEDLNFLGFWGFRVLGFRVLGFRVGGFRVLGFRVSGF